MKNRTSIHGFTLLEAMIVALIIGIIVSVGLPRYRDYYLSQSLIGMHNAVLSKFRAAPPLARVLRKEVIVVVDLDSDQVWLEVGGVRYGSKVPMNVENVVINAIAHATTPLTSGRARYSFRYWGTVTNMTGTPSLTIHFGRRGDPYNSTAPHANFRTITLMRITGRAYGYNLGCFGSNPWGNWPLCSATL